MLVKVADIHELREGRSKLVTANGEDITLLLREGRVYAISNVCAHQHFSMLHQGSVEGFIVTCPMHGWSFDYRTGQSTSGQGKVTCYKAQVRGAEVFIDLADD